MQKKTIVITRPIHQAEKLNHLLKQNGYHTILFSTLEIEPITDNQRLDEVVSQLDQYHIVIFVSANAVDSKITQRLKKWSDILIIAIGPGTAHSLQAAGLHDLIIPETYTSQGILALTGLQNIQKKKIAIFCGDPARPFLKEALQERGASVDQIPCYRRKCPSLDGKTTLNEWQSKSISMIISTSADSLANFWQIFGNIVSTGLTDIPLLVISLAMAGQAQQYGFKKVVLAENATDEAIVAAIVNYFEGTA
jgi:uroporphyrinogen-III synthase